jgi:outer membrane protein assembly factor BamB
MQKHALKNALTFLLVVFILTANSFADNWQQWRGMHNDGISNETEAPIQWSQTENVKWRLPLPGEAASTPVVWEDKIFLTSAEGDALVLMCISAEGKELWKRTLGHGNRDVRSGEANFAAPSPVTDGEHVWAFLGTGDLACYDFEGNQVWHTNIADRYGKFRLGFVMSSTPVLDKDRLYVQLIHSNAWLVLSLDKMTGKEVWKHDRKSDATAECEHAYTSPILYRDAEREYLVVHGADYVTAHSLEDGSEIWRCGGLNPISSYNYSLRFVTSPVATEGLIVVPSAKNGPVLGINPAAAPGDITDSEWQIWKRQRGTPDVPSPLIHDGLVYLCRENGNLICLDATTGEQLYRERTHLHRHRASPVYANGHIYLTSRDGVITVVKAGREFEIVASNSMGEIIAASPAIANGTLYLRSYQALYAIGGEK